MSESPDLTPPAGGQSTPGRRAFSEAPAHVQVTLLAYDAVFNQRNLDYALPDVVESACTTGEEVRGRLAGLLGAFSDLKARDLQASDLGEGRVAVRFTLSGTNDGPLGADTPATGRHFEAEMVDVVQFDSAGRVVDGRNLSDLEPIRRQLGIS